MKDPFEKHKLSDLPLPLRDMWDTSVLKRIRDAAPELFEHGWCAGGAVRRAFLGTEQEAQKASDIDFFFHSRGAFENWQRACVARGFTAKNKEHADEFTGTSIPLGRIKLQGIKGRFFQSVFALVDDFDFTICQFAIGGDWLTIGPTAINDAQGKKLVCANMHAPVAQIRRISKYGREGFRISDKQIQHILRSAVATPMTIDTPLLEEYVEE